MISDTVIASAHCRTILLQLIHMRLHRTPSHNHHTIANPNPGANTDHHADTHRHANEYADTTKEEVLSLLRESGSQIAKDLRAIPDEKLDMARELPSGRMTVEQRIERVLIGHIQGHQGSIEATIA